MCRMSAEMVACIAVESLSILEKMHSRGYVIVQTFFVFNDFLPDLLVILCVLVLIGHIDLV